jgi:hypothetical protein
MLINRRTDKDNLGTHLLRHSTWMPLTDTILSKRRLRSKGRVNAYLAV